MSEAFAEFADAARARPLAAAVILGSGTQHLISRIHPRQSIRFDCIPGLCAPSVDGHQGHLILGQWAGRRVLVFAGRLHYYEGHPCSHVDRPVLLAHELGARRVLATNAAGGIHPELRPGSLMLVRDHVLWNVPKPWLHPGPGALGPPRSSHYCPRLAQTVLGAARHVKVLVQPGIYASVTGPCYETPSEIRALRIWGADAVGMSTAREMETAQTLGMQCAAVSCITNKAAGMASERLNHQDVLNVAAGLAEDLVRLIEGFLARLGDG